MYKVIIMMKAALRFCRDWKMQADLEKWEAGIGGKGKKLTRICHPESSFLLSLTESSIFKERFMAICEYRSCGDITKVALVPRLHDKYLLQ